MKNLKLISIIRYLLALLTGGALSFAYAPTNLGFLAWFFPAVLLAIVWSTPQRSGKRDFWIGFRLAYVAGFGFWVRDVAFIGAVSLKGGWINSSAMAGYLSLFFALYGGWANTIGRPKPIEPKSQPAVMILRLAALHGLLWCGLEWLRGLSRVSFGWDGLGVSFLDSAFVLAQAADLLGVNSLSFIPVFGGVVLVLTLKAFHLEALHSYRRVHWEVSVTLLLLALTFTYGTFRLKSLHEAETFSLRTLIVQQNVPLSFNWDPERAVEVYDGFATEMHQSFEQITQRATEKLEEQGEVTIETPDIVLWPESSFPDPLWVDHEGQVIMDQENAYFFDNAIRPLGDFLFITGVNQFPCLPPDEDGNRAVDMENGTFYNAVGFFPKGFDSYSIKPKNHLMPFGEYMPFEEFKFFQLAYRYSAGMTFGGSFTPASEFAPKVTEVRGQFISIIPTVCYEDSVPSLVRKYVRDEPQMIVNVTNDGWFTGTPCAEKHYQNARFRAIEYRRPLVRAANTGVSGVVNLTGASVHPETKAPQEIRDASSSTEIKGSLNGLVEISTTPIPTLYAVVGDLFCWGGGLIVLIYTLTSTLFKKKD